MLRVAVAQLRPNRSVAEHVQRILRVVEDSSRAGAEVVLLPEAAVTGYDTDLILTAQSQHKVPITVLTVV